ncbi:CHAT domain-containing protein [Luteibacter yeojuensis]|uniref:CHAT domain-containing protein n=1 Tax=Luteibacter yeojuensis TaxID=345309 RepID=A0A7X5QRL0_9GAMM|nr:CHAT domain-containing protein [Luteibacter yeojuensis]NID14085.1 CHAT domain-containing protein [Luteibacter yeojuensis]
MSVREIEIRIERADDTLWRLGMRLTDPDSDLENVLVDRAEIAIDVDGLARETDRDAYGRRLSDMLFGGADADPVRAAFRGARSAAGRDEALRVRLSIAADASALHALRWETLRDPGDGSRLLVQDNFWFSRFLAAQDVRYRPATRHRGFDALVVVANPTDIESKWRLPAIPRDGVVARARAAVASAARDSSIEMRCHVLEGQASLANLRDALTRLDIDILYLVCHGAFAQGMPRLLLEGSDGTGQSVSGATFVECVRDIERRPRLVLLASCEGAGAMDDEEHEGALAAVGPSLAAAGIPAVVAMQGAISMTSSDRFMPRLLAELSRSGRIDRAMSVARSSIREANDWWMPVLFMRLKSGRLWQGMRSDAEDLDVVEAVAADMEVGQCVPVLGPGLIEPLFGSSRDIAQRWAERYAFPLAPGDRDDLAQVAQYLTYRQNRNVALSELRRELVARIRETYADDLRRIEAATGESLLGAPVLPGLLDSLVRHVGKLERERNPHDPHRLLASMPFSVFINANRDNLLRDALEEKGKKPRVAICTWVKERARGNQDTLRYVRFGEPLPPDFEPSEQTPLIFHVFGNLADQNSIVLTEDDYFDFLIAVTATRAVSGLRVPSVVTNALSGSGLMLLGFQPDDWGLRVLLRGVLIRSGAPASQGSVRVAVQMAFDEGVSLDPERAAQYVATYFDKNFDTRVFWGSASDFVDRLAGVWANRMAAVA